MIPIYYDIVLILLCRLWVCFACIGSLLTHLFVASDLPQARWTKRPNPGSSFTRRSGYFSLLTLYAHALAETLTAAVSKRVRDLRSNTTTSPSSSRIAILFSGGLDCATLALLAHHCLPIEEPIDLLNVAFENPRVLAASKSTEKYNVPDRLTGRNTVEELRTLCPGRIWRFVEVNIGFEESVEKKAEVLGLMKPQNTVMDYVSSPQDDLGDLRKSRVLAWLCTSLRRVKESSRRLTACRITQARPIFSSLA